MRADLCTSIADAFAPSPMLRCRIGSSTRKGEKARGAVMIKRRVFRHTFPAVWGFDGHRSGPYFEACASHLPGI